jgi:hypothetical protein
MGSLHIPLGNTLPISELFSEMPEAPKSRIRQGFSVFVTLSKQAQSLLLQAAIESTGERKAKDDADLAKSLGVGIEDVRLALTSVGLLTAMAYSRTDDPAQILQAMAAATLIAPSDLQPLLQIVPSITELRPAIKQAISKRNLADAVLPSFDHLEAVLDIRIGDEEQGGFALPVAVAFIATDSKDHRLWFQFSKEDVENMIETLGSLLTRFKEAEALIAKWPSTTAGA